MPLSAPQGSISKAVDNLRVTLADSTTFRTWVGAVDQATALVKINYESLPPPADKNEHTLAELTAYRPYALLWTSPENGFRLSHFDNESGVMMLRFVQTVEIIIADDAAEIARRFLNTLGAIFDEIMALNRVGGYLATEAIELESGPFRADADEAAAQGDYIFADAKLTWGVAE